MRISGTISPDDPATPSAQTLPAHLADLSPPNSQGGVPLPANMKDSGANANGKRPISTLDGNGDVGGPAASAGLRSARVPDAQSQVKTHPASGYTWTKPEDEPGYLWKNKRAVEDAHKAHDSLVYKDYGVLGECQPYSCPELFTGTMSLLSSWLTWIQTVTAILSRWQTGSWL